MNLGGAYVGAQEHDVVAVLIRRFAKSRRRLRDRGVQGVGRHRHHHGVDAKVLPQCSLDYSGDVGFTAPGRAKHHIPRLDVRANVGKAACCENIT